jgi:hypothetical protein
MQTDYYVLAHGQAANDRAEVRAQIEKLLVRDAKLEQLIEILKELLPAAEPVEASAAAGHEPAPEAHAEHNHHAEAPAQDSHHESHEHVHQHAGA